MYGDLVDLIATIGSIIGTDEQMNEVSQSLRLPNHSHFDPVDF